MRSSYRTALLWILSIGLFLTFYSFFTGETLAIGSVVRGLVTVLAILLGLGFPVFLRRARGWRARARKAAWLEATGQLDEAASQWEGVVKVISHLPGEWAGLLQRQAWLCLRMGREEQALELLESVRQRKEVPDREREHAQCLLALVEALRGNLERAQALVEECEDAGVVWGVVGGLALQVSLVRQGELEQALAVAVPPWDIAGEEGRNHRLAWALLRAFVLVHLPSTPERERDAQRTQEVLRSLRPGELDYLTPRWPELRAFLDQRVGVARAMSTGSQTPVALSETAPYVFSSGSFGLGLPERFEPGAWRVDWRKIGSVVAFLGAFGYLVYSDSAWVWNKLAVVAGVVLATGLGLWLLRLNARQTEKRNQEGIKALNTMRLDEAARIVDGLLEGVAGRVASHARQVLLLTRAAIFFSAGERSLARRIFHALAYQDPRRSASWLRAMALEYLADCDALEGNPKRTHETLRFSEHLWNGQRPIRWSLAPLLLAIHEGNAGRIATEAASLQALPELPEHQQRRALLLHAFALEQRPSLTSAQQAERSRLQAWLQKEGVPGEFDYLAVEWPELRAFLASLGTARAAGLAL
jgi:hypothetical protein